MEEPSRVSFRDTRLASRKAEEAAGRRSQAATWLENMAGPLGLPSTPSEKEFIACLRSGIVLCNIINKIKPGAVPKVIMNQSAGFAFEIQPLPAYQYFENIRNFLVAVEELKLPSFEASDLERDTLEVGSAAKIVDCILALKSYYECKLSTGGCGPWKHAKSPLVTQMASKFQPNAVILGSSARRLDLSTNLEKQQCVQNEDQKNGDKVDSLVQALSDCIFDSKENIDQSLLDSWCQGTVKSTKLFSKIISSCVQEQERRLILQDHFTEEKTRSTVQDPKCGNLHLLKRSCNHWNLLKSQENELAELKALLSRTRADFCTLQCQLHNDISQLGTQIKRLSSAAVGYHQAVKENKHLYNMLQELRGNIRVFCRIRPSFCLEDKSSIDHIGNDGSLMVLDPLKPQNTRKIFQFNKVFGPDASQEEVYNHTQSLVRSVMDGYNVCIFAYGQTGSGKTHTMCGPSHGPYQDMGINSMALNDLFELSCNRSAIKYEIHVQMVEIYNEQVRDLLCGETSTTKLEIRNCTGNGGLSLPDATMHSVQSTTDVLDLMKLGDQNRAFSTTAMNNRSSRSHSVLTVHVHGKDVSGSVVNSCLHLIDLAGSERVDKSEVTGDRLKEAQHINKSLSCLGDVISALAQKNSHIPYRNSKLTQLLQNSLGGHAKMLMLAHVSPEANSYGETISTLKFAQRASTVELGVAHVNKESSEIRQLKEEIDNLKKALASKEGERILSSCKAEKSKYDTENTPPWPRRLSIENSGLKKPDDKKVLKSPLPRPNFGIENGPIGSRRSSFEGSMSAKHKQVFKTSVTNHHVLDFQDSLKENICLPPHLSQEDGLDVNLSSSNETTEDIYRVSPISYSRMPLQQPNFDLTRQLEDSELTPDTNKNSKIRYSNYNTSVSKGSQIRKSLQTIGKFINGSERRTNQPSSEMTPSAKFGRNNDIVVIKSPVTADAKMRRRQSLTNAGSGISQRSSLGGQSTDSYSSDIQNSRIKTPPPAAKSAKRWA